MAGLRLDGGDRRDQGVSARRGADAAVELSKLGADDDSGLVPPVRVDYARLALAFRAGRRRAPRKSLFRAKTLTSFPYNRNVRRNRINS